MGRHGVRSSWDDVPPTIRDALDDLLGAEVTVTEPLAGGFSPGPAVRATLSDGDTVFIKAAGTSLNPHSPAMHRREGHVLAGLPSFVPSPSLRGVVDDGDWVALAVEWVDGRHPAPSDPDDLDRVLGLLHEMADLTDGIEIGGVEPLAATHPDLFDHWCLLAGDAPAGLDEWSRRHAERLAEVDRHAAEASVGSHLAHVDVRTDNLLLASDRDVLVDWPGASFGAPWVDLATLLPALHLDGGPPPGDVFDSTSLGRKADPEAVDAFVVSLAGYFTRMSLLPAPPGLPTLRGFQAAQGVIARRWVAERLDLD